jgi:hypothetical protein
MDRRTFLASIAALSALTSARRSSAAGRLVVIANKSVSATSLSAGDLEAIFTTRKLYWPDGRPIVCFNFPARHSIRVAFDQAALHLSPDEVARFWIDRRVRGGHPAPRQVPDESTMLRVVARLGGAVGYVPKDNVDGNVSILAEL